MAEANRLLLYVSEVGDQITKQLRLTPFSYSTKETIHYGKSYEQFEPDERLINTLLVNRCYINVTDRPMRGKRAVYSQDKRVVEVNTCLISDIPVKDFLFDLLSPNPDWREVFPGETSIP